MILGESAFIYRKTGTQTYLSAGQGENTEPIHSAYVDANNAPEELQNWRPEFGNNIWTGRWTAHC